MSRLKLPEARICQKIFSCVQKVTCTSSICLLHQCKVHINCMQTLEAVDYTNLLPYIETSSKLTSQKRRNFVNYFYDPVTIVRLIKICPSVHLSVTLYGIECVISSNSFQWIFLKPCIPVVDILKMCMWDFDGARINFDRITAFQT